VSFVWQLGRGHSRGRRRSGRRLLGLVAIAAVAAWTAGFAWFVTATMRPQAVPPRADGIVVLTGGAERVSAALRLLADNRAGKLLVTGIGGGAHLRDLAGRAGINPAPLAARVTLGRGATSTRGNAEETAAWVRSNGMRSLIVVTAFYHMPRALAEIGRAVPSVRLYPAPVSPPGMRDAAGLETVSGLRARSGPWTEAVGAPKGS
jgi:uncharacterized SAM-binding protein YcdF (DUF218 family)